LLVLDRHLFVVVTIVTSFYSLAIICLPNLYLPVMNGVNNSYEWPKISGVSLGPHVTPKSMEFFFPAYLKLAVILQTRS